MKGQFKGQSKARELANEGKNRNYFKILNKKGRH